MSTEIVIVPYGEISNVFTSRRRLGRHIRIADAYGELRGTFQHLFVTFSQDLDAPFKTLFRQQAPAQSRLLVLNEGLSADSVLSRIFDLQIRSSQRCYVIEATGGCGKSAAAGALIHALLDRLVSGIEANDSHDRILDARIDGGILHVVSPNFERLDVPLSDISAFKNVDASKVETFEIDEDGAFIYWPELDVHLGWSQLKQIVDPEAALKASQKSEAFNRRYGKAVQKLRLAAGIKASDVHGISEKQLGRIERGECRLTTNAIEGLSSAHGLEPNKYMQMLAEALE